MELEFKKQHSEGEAIANLVTTWKFMTTTVKIHHVGKTNRQSVRTIQHSAKNHNKHFSLIVFLEITGR